MSALSRIPARLAALLGRRGTDPLAPYRQWVRARALAWGGSEAEPAQVMALEQRFVEADTTAQVSAAAVEEFLSTGHTGGRGLRPQNARDLRPLTVLEAWMLQRRVLVQGAAGSGKSFTLARLAIAILENRWRGFRHRPRDLGNLPILLDLGDYAAWLAGQGGGATGLLVFFRQILASIGLSHLESLLLDALHSGQTVILADGLDEVGENFRDPVAMALVALEQRFPSVPILVSCRSDEPCALPADRFPRFQLAPLSNAQQRALLRWPPDEAVEDGRWPPEPLLALLDKPWLAILAGNPLLLNAMARVYAHDRGLPVEQAMLLERLVDIWLWRGQGDGGGPPPVLALLAEAGLGMADLRRELRRLAFDMVTTQLEEPTGDDQDGEALADAPTVVTALSNLHPQGQRDWAEQLVAALSRPGALWQQRQGRIGFVHPLVQQYLAGTYLALETNLIATVSQLVRRHGGWWSVILWAVAHRVHVLGEQQLSVALAVRLCPLEYPLEDQDWRRVFLAGEILQILGSQRLNQAEPMAQAVLERVQERLTLLVEEGQLSVLERAVAGDCLGRLGDERFASAGEALPTHFRQTLEPAQGFVKIHAGTCYLGKVADGGTGSEYGNTGPVEIPYPYWVGRYPVTVGQFSAFMAAGGYREPHWWSMGGQGWLGDGYAEPAHWQQQSRYPNRPVTGICWFEALAYCRWLDERLHDGQHDSADYVVRLASEAEWEKVARHGDTRPYPWGETPWSAARANLAESDLGRPTTVGLFPAGGSPLAVQDLIGNVWEWTLSGFQSYPYDPHCNRARDQVPRTVRGGSWDSRASTVQASTRSALFPEARLNDVGFRVVVGPREEIF